MPFIGASGKNSSVITFAESSGTSNAITISNIPDCYGYILGIQLVGDNLVGTVNLDLRLNNDSGSKYGQVHTRSPFTVGDAHTTETIWANRQSQTAIRLLSSGQHQYNVGGTIHITRDGNYYYVVDSHLFGMDANTNSFEYLAVGEYVGSAALSRIDIISDATLKAKTRVWLQGVQFG